MRAAIISDIHSNLPALVAVLSDIETSGVTPDELWCLGDIVGYGATPDACAALTDNLADVCLAGNHDLVIRGDLDISHFTMAAGEAARWTAEHISDRTRAFLDRLKPVGQRREAGLYHASP